MVRFVIRMLISGAAVFGVAYFSNGSLLVVESLIAGVILSLIHI